MQTSVLPGRKSWPKISLTLLLAGCALLAPSAAAPAQSGAAAVDARPFPRQFQQGGLRFWLHSPQFESLAGNKLTGRAAVSVQLGERTTSEGRTEPVLTYGVIWFEARAEIDKLARTATLSELQVQRVSFPTQTAHEARYRAGIQEAALDVRKVVSLDQLEASIALAEASPPGGSLVVRNDPPEILLAYAPTVLIAIDGAPALRPMSTPGVQRVINTRSLILHAGGSYYLRLGGRWARTARLDSVWTLAPIVPDMIARAHAEAAAAKVADPMDRPADDVRAMLERGRLPAIAVRTRPAELVPVAGQPQFAPIAGTRLSYVANSPADIFVLGGNDWYVLLSGRWFTARLATGPWRYVASSQLPADFRRIPPESPKSAVLASISGTPQAREALIANSIPQMASISRSKARYNAVYDGAPDFEPIVGTELSYARNSAVPVIRVNAALYYSVSDGIWFTASTPRGPWTVAVTVAPAIYTIPASSTLHYLTYVRVYGTSGDTIHVGYTSGYYGTIVSDNVVVYGSGYTCRSWIGSAWYGCAAAYGTGAYWPGYYNAALWGQGAYQPVAGAWNVYGRWGNAVVSGTAAAWANPWTGNYGRAGEGAYYNQATGGRGVGQAAVNTNAYTGTTSAAARGARYNPTTGRAVAGEGVAATNPYTGQSGVAGRRDVYNSNTGRRTTSVGAAGRGPEGAAAAGAFSSQGPAGDVSGVGGVRYDRDSGTVTGAGAVAVGDDVYAGRDGNVYKQTSDGWQQVERGNSRVSPAGQQSLDRERFARERGSASARSIDGNRLDRSTFGGSFGGRTGGERPAMGRSGRLRRQ